MFKQRLLSMVILAGLLMGQTVPMVSAATACDQAQFVSDITVPDGASYAPGDTFTKTWRFLNVGSCEWTTSYSIVFVGGDSLGATQPVSLPVNVPPGQMLDISVNLTAPMATGHFKSLWMFSNSSGQWFGIGDNGNSVFWADINVVVPNDIIYDFTSNAQNAQWKSGAGSLSFPGIVGDYRGYGYQLDQPHLEDDSIDNHPGLFMAPQNKYNGYIQATFPSYTVQPGDRLQTLVNCEFGATGCTVTFRIDYILPNGGQIRLWQWKETYDNRFYRADIDLSPLAGKQVRFVFMVLASGYAYRDRAIWGSPQIVRAGSPPASPSQIPTATPQPTLPPSTLVPADCDMASFVSDVNVPDGTIFTPGASFTKTWRLKNSGKCTWTTEYKLTFYSGEQMSAPVSVNLPYRVYPGSTSDISVNLVAPNYAGSYRGFWILSNASGTPFGIGTNAANPFWVDIKVVGDAFNQMGYDFAANACVAEWKSGAGPLPCPGVEGDTKGFVIPAKYTQLEDGTVGPAPSILMAPQYKYNGYIQGFFPAIDVKKGDVFHTVVGCEKSYNCYVTFRLDYMTPNGYIGNFWSWREYSDNKNYTVDVDLSPLAGKNVRFILTLLATGYATNDRVRWTSPYILREGTVVIPTATSAPPAYTATAPVSSWPTYTNTTYGFEFKYPPQSQISNEQSGFVHITLPITSGTNLMEKYLETTITENANGCESPFSSTAQTSETVTINGVNFLKQAGGDAAAGNHYEWTAYSTYRGNNCVSMSFMLHSLGAGAFTPPVPEFDRAAESSVFSQIMQTLAWAINTPTATSTTPATSTPVSGGSGVIVSSPSINKLYMQNTFNGWATGDNYILRTTDGGANWYNMLANISPLSAYFSSSTTGWVLTANNTLYRTTDSGSTWLSYNIPFNGGYIQFLDSLNGYVLSGEQAGMQKHPVYLYRTTDGGATWTLKYTNDPVAGNPGTSLPFSGHKSGMAFRDSTNGWVGGDYPTNGFVYLFRTSDGGTNWSQVQLSLPSGYESAFISTTAPKFFNANDGILPVWMTLGTGMKDLFLYTTHDGGNTWSASSNFARNAELTDLISLTSATGWDWSNTFHVTGNSGSTWQTVNPNLNFADTFRSMDFISTTTGWLIENPVNGSTPLYRTFDGGATWTLLSGTPTVPVTATPTTPPPTTTPIPAVTSLDAKVTAGLLSCRYGPGAEYLYLYGLNQGANIKLIGRTDANNWVWVNGANNCWVNANYLTINGDRNALPIVYPGIAKLPVSPYYPPPAWASASRNGNTVAAEWAPVIVGSGDYEDASMHPYILEVWRCEAGQTIFETLGSSTPIIYVANDEPGCSSPSHGRVYVQEKHGYAGPVEVPWPQPVTATATPLPSPTPEAITHEAFCSDSRIPLLLSQIKSGTNQSDGSLFSTIVSPTHGLDVRLWAYQPAVNFSVSNVNTIFTDITIYDWGSGPSGFPDNGTFKDVIQPKLLEVLNAPGMEIYCDTLTKVYPLANPWPYPDIRYYNLYKPGSPGVILDYRTWLIGFEYINGQPYLHSMVTIVWEP